MSLFERSEQPDVFVEDSNVVPIIIKYTESNEKYYNENNKTSFTDAISQYAGVHTCVFVNDGMSKGRNPQQQFLIYLEDAGLYIRTRIDGNGRSFYGSLLFTGNCVIPTDENEFIRRRCNISIEDTNIDVIDNTKI